MKKFTQALVGIAASLCFSGVANATLIGDQILIEQNLTTAGTLRSDLVTVVAGSAELSCPGSFQLCGANIPGFSQGSIDIEASSILFNLGSVASIVFLVDVFNGYIFSDLDWVGAPGTITGVGLTTDIPGLDSSRVSFGTDFVAVNFQGLSFSGNGLSFNLDLGVAHAVPEPTTLAIFAFGLAGLGFAARRRRQGAAT